MKKVCIVRHGYYPEDVRVRKEALALIEKGYKVDVICILKNPDDKRKGNYKGVNYYRIPLQHHRKGVLRYLFEYGSFFCLASIKLCRLFARNRYDFIQINTLPDFLVFVAIVPKLFGAKVILDLHEPAPELWGAIFGAQRKLLMWIVKSIEQISIRYADRSITVSEEMKSNYIKRGASPSKMSVILNVPNLEFNLESFHDPTSSGKNNKFLLLCHGAMIKRYGQGTAIKAMALIKEKIPNVELNILGYGDYEKELKRLTSHLKLNKYVKFRGFLPFEEMVEMVAISDIGIVPVEKNPYSDLVHTNKMFEYIAMKKPVVISRTRAVEGFFGSDDSCLKYFTSGNEKDLARCIIELYNKPEKREEMVKNAYDKFELVRWEIVKEDYCSLFL